MFRRKKKAFEKFKDFKAMVENETNCKIKCIRSDNGREFTSKGFDDFCKQHGNKKKFTIIETPLQNGVVERAKILVHLLARAMMRERNIQKIFWVEAIHKAILIIKNTLQTKQ